MNNPLQEHPVPESPPKGFAMDSVRAQRILELGAARHDRLMDALLLWEPMPSQEEFHKNGIQQRLVRKGNRSGGTAVGAVEFARAARGMDPYGKYPKPPLRMYLIGYGESHIGRVFHKYLFRPGVFKIIRDESGQWRAFRPWEKWDAEHAELAKPAPPLIPRRDIEAEGFAWIDKRASVFKLAKLKNGTEIWAFSSGSEPSIAQGDAPDVVWFDEDLDNTGWVPEMQRGLSDRKGKLFWTAYPHVQNDALITLSERAEKEAELPDPGVVELRLTFSDNRYIDEEEKTRRRRDFSYLSEAEWASRDRGDFPTEQILMYPQFNMRVHGAPYPELNSAFEVQVADGIVPREWTRYLFLDPGHATCAALFVAVPPPKVGDYALIYDEVYLHECTAEKLAKAVSAKANGQVFQSFIIDVHGAAPRDAGLGIPYRQQYAAAFQRHGLASVATGNSFADGSDDRLARSNLVRTWLSPRDNAPPKLRVLHGRCPHVLDEFRKYRRQKVKSQDGVLYYMDVADPRSKHSHAMNCVEYAAAHGCRYVPPQPATRPMGPGYRAYHDFLSWVDRWSHGEREESIVLGPRN